MKSHLYLACISVFTLISCEKKLRRDVHFPATDTVSFVSKPVKNWVENQEIDEASGMAASFQNPRKFWVHNDSGGENVLFLIDEQGHGFQKLYLDGIKNRDWEDIAVVKTGNSASIYLAETGDNFRWRLTKYIYRVAEPKLGMARNTSTNRIETIEFELEDGRKDAECILIDPQTKDIFIIANREPQKHIYCLKYPQSTTEHNIAKFVGILSASQEKPTDDKKTRQDLFVTSGTISEKGDEILVKNYQNIFYWKKSPNETIAQTLQRPAKILPYEVEAQGEAVTFSFYTKDYYTISEKGHPKNRVYLSCYKRKE